VDVVLVVDVANVMGSRPDGWWRDRAAAAGRVLASLSGLPGQTLPGPDGDNVLISRVVAVVEGAARTAAEPGGDVEVVRAAADGDSAIVALSEELRRESRTPLVVTADRGLRARLPTGSLVGGPRWLLALVG